MYPGVMLHFDIIRKKSILAVDEAVKSNQLIFLVAQKNIKDNDPKKSQVYKFGVLATIKQVISQPGESIKVLLEGKCRAEALEYYEDGDFLRASVRKVEEIQYPSDIESEALIRKCRDLFSEYLSISPKPPVDLILNMNSYDKIGKISDYIASNIVLDFKEKQELLEEVDTLKRITKLIVFLSRENEIVSYENEIALKIKKFIDKNQKEYFLREQIKVLSQELGEDSDPLTESEEYKRKLKKLKLSKDINDKLKKECENFSKIPVCSSEANLIRTYLDTCFSLPWNKSSKDILDVSKAKKVLDKGHFGLKDVKERILEFLSVKKLAPDIKGQIICLVGPPGVGKTSIAKSLAEAMGRKYVRISLGGVSDESEIRGHRKTYIGAMPGRIISAIKQVGTNNPVIVLDEIDKLSNDYRGDPSSALLEALDPEQNCEFYDRYIEVPFDLSNVLFIATANDSEYIPEPLYDRMEIINVCSYTAEEKFNIAKKHLIPKQLKKHGLTKKSFSMDDECLGTLIKGYTKEAGVRELERNIAAIMRKSAKLIVEDNKKSVDVDIDTLKKFLGPIKYKNEKIDDGENIGVVQGLAWTAVGGEVMPIEVSLMKGKGDVQITGSLGDVMRESVQLAVSYIRSNYLSLNVKRDFYKTMDIHVHAPEGAVPKDGPSAGVTIATALLSALNNIPVKPNIAMTGEITLKGRVIPIGGLKEKCMAAYSNGVKTVIIPRANENDIEKIDDIVKKSVDFVKVNNLNEVFKHSLNGFENKNLSKKKKVNGAV